MTKINATRIRIVNNISVTVPNNAKFLTTYILTEQNDWFEDEIKFLRKFIKPGMYIIDIGANYGLYTLSAASCLKNQGHIWAFEPTTFTHNCLHSSIEANNFKNITLIHSALSNKRGKAKLYLSSNSELNTLSKASTDSEQYETINLSTLDHCYKHYKWRNIDFLKIDAEGEENKILSKSKKFFTEQSPLVMFELKHKKEINTFLIKKFASLGYSCFKLIPSLNLLVKFDQKVPFDSFLLNLFCCKKDKVKQLQENGIIATKTTAEVKIDGNLINNYIDRLPYLNIIVNQNEKECNSNHYQNIFASYVMSRCIEVKIEERLEHLMNALAGVKKALEKGESRIHRLSTYSRIALDAGERNLCVNILIFIIDRIIPKDSFNINETFFPACKLYEQLPTNGNINKWLCSSIIEQYIKRHAYSTYFTQEKTLPLFEKLTGLGFMSEEMKRRHQLIKMCYSAAQ